MTKKTSIIRFTILTIVAIIGIILTFFSFTIPFTNHIVFKGFANSISMGLDIKGGVSAVYKATVDDGVTDFNTRLNATITRLQNLLINGNYPEATVTQQGNDQIRVEVPDVNNPDDLFNLIGTPAQLEIRATSDGPAVLTGKNITAASAVYDQQQGQYGVQVVFDSAGTKLFSDLTTQNQGGYIYIVINGQPLPALSVKNAITDGKTLITGGSITDLKSAQNYATQILSGTFSVNLSLVSNSIISATLGADALMYGLIAGAIGLFLIMIFLIVYYRMLGVLACFALVFYTILFIFFLQALPMVQLTLPGIAGIFLSLGMAVDGNIIIFERIKEEYRSGKRIPASVKAGFKNAMSAILDSNITTIIAALVLYLLGNGPIQGFAIVLLIGNVISVFSSVILTRAFINMYLPFNSTRAKAFNLKREEAINENK